MASKDDKKQADSAQPGFDPKPVALGGESIVDRLMPYRKRILIAVLLGFAVWGVIAIAFWIRNSGREKNTAKLAKVMDVAQREVKEPEPGAGSGSAGSAADAPKEITYPTNKARAEAVLEAIGKAGADVSGTYKASMLMQAGRLDEAIAEYRKHQTGRSLDSVLAREGLGIALETKAAAEKDAAARQKGLEEALSVFQTMQPDEKGPRRDYALYHQGRVLAALGKTADARAAFQKAKDLGGESSPLGSVIEERLAGLGAT